MYRRLCVVVVLACGAPLAAMAQEQVAPSSVPSSPPNQDQGREQPPAELTDPRFVLHRLNDGYLRLDKRSGEVAMCSKHAAGWACNLVPDERTAVDSEIARLQKENALLKSALLERGLSLPSGVGPSAKAASPEDAEIDRVMGVMEKIWRRLVDMMADIQRDMRKKG
jgi:hypothetical protein